MPEPAVPLSVVLDTNAAMMPFQFRLNLDEELGRLLGAYRIIVPSRVLHELKALARTKPKARAALALVRRRGYRVVPVEGKGDDAVVQLAVQERAVVLTNDGALRRALREAHVPTIYLRSRRHLVLEPGGVLDP